MEALAGYLLCMHLGDSSDAVVKAAGKVHGSSLSDLGLLCTRVLLLLCSEEAYSSLHPTAFLLESFLRAIFLRLLVSVTRVKMRKPPQLPAAVLAMERLWRQCWRSCASPPWRPLENRRWMRSVLTKALWTKVTLSACSAPGGDSQPLSFLSPPSIPHSLSPLSLSSLSLTPLAPSFSSSSLSHSLTVCCTDLLPWRADTPSAAAV